MEYGSQKISLVYTCIEIIVNIHSSLNVFTSMKEIMEILQRILNSLAFRVKITKLPLRHQRTFGCGLLTVKIQHRNLRKVLNDHIILFYPPDIQLSGYRNTETDVNWEEVSIRHLSMKDAY